MRTKRRSNRRGETVNAPAGSISYEQAEKIVIERFKQAAKSLLADQPESHISIRLRIMANNRNSQLNIMEPEFHLDSGLGCGNGETLAVALVESEKRISKERKIAELEAQIEHLKKS